MKFAANLNLKGHQFFLLTLYMSRNVNTAVKLFNEIVKGIFDRHAPEAAWRVRGKPCPWLNADLKKLMIDRDRSYVTKSTQYQRGKSLALI